MANNQAAQKSEWQGNKEMNIKENSSATDGEIGNENTGESSWRPADDQESKDSTEFPTGAAGQSPAPKDKTD